MLGVPQRTGLAMPTQSMCNASTKVALVAWATLHRWTPVSSSLLQDSNNKRTSGCAPISILIADRRQGDEAGR